MQPGSCRPAAVSTRNRRGWHRSSEVVVARGLGAGKDITRPLAGPKLTLPVHLTVSTISQDFIRLWRAHRDGNTDRYLDFICPLADQSPGLSTVTKEFCGPACHPSHPRRLRSHPTAGLARSAGTGPPSRLACGIVAAARGGMAGNPCPAWKGCRGAAAGYKKRVAAATSTMASMSGAAGVPTQSGLSRSRTLLPSAVRARTRSVFGDTCAAERAHTERTWAQPPPGYCFEHSGFGALRVAGHSESTAHPSRQPFRVAGRSESQGLLSLRALRVAGNSWHSQEPSPRALQAQARVPTRRERHYRDERLDPFEPGDRQQRGSACMRAPEEDVHCGSIGCLTLKRLCVDVKRLCVDARAAARSSTLLLACMCDSRRRARPWPGRAWRQHRYTGRRVGHLCKTAGASAVSLLESADSAGRRGRTDRGVTGVCPQCVHSCLQSAVERRKTSENATKEQLNSG